MKKKSLLLLNNKESLKMQKWTSPHWLKIATCKLTKCEETLSCPKVTLNYNGIICNMGLGQQIEFWIM